MKRQQKLQYLGYISDEVADKAGVMNGSIFVDPDALKHIASAHRKELAVMGLSALDFVTSVASGYTEIRQGTNNSILLVVRKRPNRVLAIRLHCYVVMHFYEVATAFPVRNKELENYELLYKK